MSSWTEVTVPPLSSRCWPRCSATRQSSCNCAPAPVHALDPTATALWTRLWQGDTLGEAMDDPADGEQLTRVLTLVRYLVQEELLQFGAARRNSLSRSATCCAVTESRSSPTWRTCWCSTRFTTSTSTALDGRRWPKSSTTEQTSPTCTDAPPGTAPTLGIEGLFRETGEGFLGAAETLDEVVGDFTVAGSALPDPRGRSATRRRLAAGVVPLPICAGIRRRFGNGVSCLGLSRLGRLTASAPMVD